MTRTLLVAGNWKMNLGLRAATELAQELAAAIARSDSPAVAVFPPFPWLLPVRDALAGSSVHVGAQNCHARESGAFTGEVSAAMLADVCEYVLTGHSERRHVFGETDELVGAKLQAILAAGLQPILCVGELLEERRAALAEEVVTRQLATGLAQLGVQDLDRLTVAYEPVWAIGTGVAATPNDAQQMSSMIRRWLHEQYGEPSEPVRVLYGGSVTPDNALELFSQPDVDGGLIGGASLRATSFVEIVGAARAVERSGF
jgi:triosephosphate isomerase